MIEAYFGLTPLEWAFPVLIGVVAGLGTNAVAIWMLFHPYEDVRIGPVRLLPKGAIPQEIHRIARKVGETVGRELLTPVDIVRTLSSPGFQQRFDLALHDALARVLEREVGSLRDLVPPEQSPELEKVLRTVGTRLRIGVDRYLESVEFERAVRRFTDSLATDLRDRSLQSVLGAEGHGHIVDRGRQLWRVVRESEAVEAAARDAVRIPIERIMVSEKPLRHYLPARAVNLGEMVVERYLPYLLDRFGDILDEPGTREKIQRVLRSTFERFLEEQRSWWRVVGRLVVTERTLAQTVRAIEEGGVEEIAALLREPEVQQRIAAAVNEGVEDLLDRPVRDLLGDVSEDRITAIQSTVADRLVYVLRHPETERVLTDRLDRMLLGVEKRTIGDLVDFVGAERARALGDALADWVLETARGARVSGMLDTVFERRMTWLLTVPIGRPADLVPAGFGQRLEAMLAEPLWTFIQRRVPDAVAGLPVAEMVERKLIEFPLQKVEELIWRVSKRELVLIVFLGGFLGAMIGSIMVLTLSPAAGAVTIAAFMLATFIFMNLRASSR